jgi:flagellar protein FliS
MSYRAAKRYTTVSLHSASPQQMLTEVFHRLIRTIAEAERCIGERDIVGKSKSINHAIDLVNALASSLDFNAAPELCGNLERLYGYVQQRLLAASAEMSVPPLKQAESVLTNLRDAFAEAAAHA